MTTHDAHTAPPPPDVPETNRTVLGLYATPEEAYRMSTADPEHVHILDVRTFEEYIFVGHVETAKNIPLVFPSYDPVGPSMPGRPPGCSGELNPDFVAKVKETFDPADTILAMCATGGRGAMAVNLLAQAGFTHVYNIVNGRRATGSTIPGASTTASTCGTAGRTQGSPGAMTSTRT